MVSGRGAGQTPRRGVLGGGMEGGLSSCASPRRIVIVARSAARRSSDSSDVS